MSEMNAALFLFALVSPEIVVVETRVQGEQSRAELGQSLAAAIGGLSPAEAAARFERELPLPPSGKREPILEADRLVQSGRDAYLEGHFAEAATQLAQAREVLRQTVESLDEERLAADALFRAYMYLAFTLRSRGGDYVASAREVMRDALRTFPNGEPSFNEYGPENLKFYRDVKAEMEQGPTGSLRVRTAGEPANVYLNGRLIGVTPLEQRRVYAGRYRIHLRQGAQPSRSRTIEVKSGDNDFVFDLGLDRALQTQPAAALVYQTDRDRRALYRVHAVELVRGTGARAVLVYSRSGDRTALTWIDPEGHSRHVVVTEAEAPAAAAGLRDATVGEADDHGKSPTRHRLWTWVAAGGAAAAMTAGLLIGASVDSDINDLKQKYPGGIVTDPADSRKLDDAHSNATLETVMYGVAGGAALAAVALYFFEGRANDSTEGSAIVPEIGSRFAGASWRFRF